MNGQSTSTQLDQLHSAKAEAVARYLKPNGNIVGVGISQKLIDNTPTDCVRIYVVLRQDESAIPASQLVPKGTTINGVPVDVIEVGPFGKNGQKPIKDDGTTTQMGSPIRVKTAATNVNEGKRGTLGAVVTDGEAYYILGCNHVLAVNGRVPADPDLARVVSGEFVGVEAPLASPDEFVPLLRNTANAADCAIARLKDRDSVPATFPEGTVRLVSPEAARLEFGMPVHKFGAGTGLTSGFIVDTDVDLYVDYSFGTFLFEHQIVIQSSEDSLEFATGGDSGSMVIAGAGEQEGRATALIFAASGTFAVACPFYTVLSELAAQLKKVSRPPVSLVVPVQN
uniref:Uncharacterized protein n=1 Tax=Solibacter usitatus (strain Ellin6076) TaxID=234267 RepID=Q02D99_SOLUE